MKLKRKILCVLFVVAVLAFSLFAFVACKEDAVVSNVTYVVDGSIYSSLKVEDGTELQPASPKKDLYKFDGWYTDSALTAAFDFDEYAADETRGDVIVYAKFTFSGSVYTVTYDANGGTFDNEQTTSTAKVNEQSVITSKQAEPAREGYEFSGWSRNKNGTKTWYLNTDTVTENVTLYAVWSRIFTVTYNANGGVFENNEDELETEAAKGSYLLLPEEPSRRGYTFEGWATRSTATESNWDFDEDTVSADTELYAVWAEVVDEYDVKFVLNYGDAEDVVKSTEKGLITYEPEREGYIFNGWWNSSGKNDKGEYVLTTRYDTTVRVTRNNLVLYASWISEDSLCERLPAPSVSVSDSVITWEPVEGATGYRILIYKSGNANDSQVYSTTSTSYTFSTSNDYGTYYVQVKAIGDGYTTANSAYSSSRSFTHKALGSVNYKFDVTTSLLTVNKVNRANTYKLYVDNVFIKSYSSGFEYDMSKYDAGDHSVRIEVSNSDTSVNTTFSVRKLKLVQPAVYELYNNSSKVYTLNWSKVEGADSYKVTIGNSTSNVTGTSYTVASSNFAENDEIVYTVAAFDTTREYLISDADEHTLGRPVTLRVEKSDSSAGSVSVSNAFAPLKCTVLFNANGGSGAPSSQTVTSSSALTYPSTVPGRTGYVFTGWYTSPECSKLFDFSKTIYSDTVLYAGWSQMVERDFYNRYAASILAVNGSSNSKYYSSNGTSSSTCSYVYFTVLNNGTYKLYYCNSQSGNNYGIYVNVTNATQNRTIKSNSMCNSTTYSYVEFEANAGDVICVKYYRNNTSYSPSLYLYVTTEGSVTPAEGGSCNEGYVNGNLVTAPTATVEAGTEVTLSASTNSGYTFAGWYDEDGKLLSSERTYKTTFNKSATITAKWE